MAHEEKLPKLHGLRQQLVEAQREIERLKQENEKLKADLTAANEHAFELSQSKALGGQGGIW